MIIEAIGRRLRLGVIGGGPGSEIGEVHRIAARLDDLYEIVASALSSDPERSRRSGRALGVAEDRAYASWRALVESEAGRGDRPDVVAVMTPNDSHYEICTAALDAGFHVICDKPLTTNLATAVDLVRKVKETGAEFCVAIAILGIRWCARHVPWSIRERSVRYGRFTCSLFRVISLSMKRRLPGVLIQIV